MEPAPDWVRELAYQLWAFHCSQNVAKVADLLNSGQYRDDGGIVPDEEYVDGELPVVTITRQAINQWKNKGWPQRLASDVRDLAPEIHQQVAGNLMAASLKAAEFYAAVMNEEIIPNKDDQKFIDTKYRIAADILSRTGHMPHTRPSDNTALPGPKVDHRKAIAGMSDEERRAIIEGSLSPKQPEPESDVIDIS